MKTTSQTQLLHHLSDVAWLQGVVREHVTGTGGCGAGRTRSILGTGNLHGMTAERRP